MQCCGDKKDGDTHVANTGMWRWRGAATKPSNESLTGIFVDPLTA